MTRPYLASIIIACLASCGGKAANKPVTPPTAPAATDAIAATPPTTSAPASPNVAVASDLAKQCRLTLASTERAPKFSYNEAELLAADRALLQQVADCLTKGPLKGKSVQLVGHADPRGTDEYNLGLGSRRAETVRSYLLRLGVPTDHVAPTTRGELDASGSDESGWRRDRRVDLQLVN